ncbi:MAG: hypothetical protein M5U35_06515 [Roseovarius sp.]|nr:hypothetical protein [Roseovarius sp.]
MGTGLIDTTFELLRTDSGSMAGDGGGPGFWQSPNDANADASHAWNRAPGATSGRGCPRAIP